MQALLAGSGALMLLTPAGLGIGALWVFKGSVAVHLALALGEASMGHPTAHAALAASNMIRGRYATYYWGGLGLALAGLILVAVLPGLGVTAALVGLLSYEHAYVQAGQSVPLA